MISNLLKASLILIVSTSVYAQEKGMKAYVTLFPAGDFVASTNDVTGQAEVLPNGDIQAKDIRINLKTLKTGMELRDDHAKNKYLEVSKYPEAILVTGTGKGGVGTGVLKMKDKQANIDGKYTLLAGKKAVKAEFNIKLSSFGINEINFKGVGVDDEVKVEVIIPVGEAAAAKPAAAAGAPAATPAKPATPTKLGAPTPQPAKKKSP